MRDTFVLEILLALLACFLIALFPALLKAQSATDASQHQMPTVFHVKYVSEGSLYIDAGKNADLQEGMKLSVIDPPPDGMVNEGVRFRGYPHVAELNLVSVADSSAVCDVVTSNTELKVGQLAFLTPNSVEDRHLAENAREADDYPIMVAFTSGDPIDQELRSTKVENPNLAESPLGVMRARFGFSYGDLNESGMNSTQLGMMIDADMTHIGGTYWNFNGYWRGNYNVSTTSPPGSSNQTLTDLINRTYHIGFVYDSPYSPNTVGVGRLFLPWAPSLSTIDGGYYGRHIGNFVTVGVFGGSTPDPTSWSYNPDQQIAGTFVSMERGDFDGFHFMSTAGLAMTSISWRVARQFAFFENNFNWKRYLSVYSSLQIDEARTSPLPGGGSNPTGISQTYNSVHVQPIKLVTLGANYNYFRNLPTFDPRLIGTGLVDNYLFQGFSGDVRFDLPKHISLYAALGQSKASTDNKKSLNDAFGVTFGNLFRTGLSLDLHYSKFNSDFGSGDYQSISLSKSLTEKLRLQVLGGNQKFTSSFTSNTNAKFVNATIDWSIGRRYFVEGLYGWYSGNALSYNQWSTMFGYRWGGLSK
ncbi:MAG TPA: hypothetical protein VJX72_05385 [Candidatus Acidoferrum sp.]|nr:hypothetical protein [Candidatus Acidoferrum sp.]